MNQEANYRTYSTLKELRGSGFEIVNGEPDIRGWTVKSTTNEIVGEVEELIFDVESQKVRYIVLDLKRNVFDLVSRLVLVPVGLAELDETDDEVILPNITKQILSSLPKYKKGQITAGLESAVRNSFAGIYSDSEDFLEIDETTYNNQEFYNHQHFQNQNLYRRRSPQNQSTQAVETVIGYFENNEAARHAAHQLQQKGVTAENVHFANSNDNGSLSGFFSNPVPENDRTKHFNDERENDNTIVVQVHTTEELYTVTSVLKQYGALEVNNASDLNQRSSERANPNVEITQEIPPRPVQSGEFANEVQGKDTKTTDFSPFSEGTIEIKQYKEVPIVTKEARVVEEVSLNKDVNETKNTIHETVRKTEVDIERIDGQKRKQNEDL